jgi:hypothetical protein
MDIAGALLDSFGEDRVKQADDRCFITQVQQVFGVAEFGGNRGEVFTLQLLQHLAGGSGHAGIGVVDGVGQDRSRDEDRLDRFPKGQPQFIQGQQCRRTGDGNLDGPVVLGQRQDTIAAGKA